MNKALVHVPDDVLYRYEDKQYSLGLDQFDEPIPGSATRVNLLTFAVLKRTPCGAWIHCYDTTRSGNFTDKKFVRLTARKQFASNTKDEAIDCFRWRKKRQILILKAQLKNAETALQIVDKHANNLQAIFYG